MTTGRERYGRLRAVMLNVALIGISLLLAAGAAELFLRLFPSVLPQEAQLRLHWAALQNMAGPRGERMVEDDDYLAFRYRPHATGTDGAGEATFTVTTDEHGFRNPSPWPERSELVVVGDSLALGYGVSREESWAGLLAAAVAPERLINLARSGYGPPQYTRAYARLGVPLRPRVLLYSLLPANDAADAANFERWLEAGRPTDYLVWRHTPLWSGGERGGPLSTMLSLARQSYFATFLLGTMRQLRSPYKDQTLTLADGRRVQVTPARLALQAAHISRDAPGFRAAMAAIDEARALAQRQGTSFLVVVMPTKEDIYLPPLGQPTPELIQPFLDEFAERGIDYLDLRPVLWQAAKESGAALFFEVDGHPNAAG
ncbi:MAG TPA: hypothetical protein VFG43_03905, partial [Geminicoccaceae bacterium]|nr:hypothetical protein [Geminicoccaceae bacterium]